VTFPVVDDVRDHVFGDQEQEQKDGDGDQLGSGRRGDGMEFLGQAIGCTHEAPFLMERQNLK
jgi:hypothetical protein